MFTFYATLRFQLLARGVVRWNQNCHVFFSCRSSDSDGKPLAPSNPHHLQYNHLLLRDNWEISCFQSPLPASGKPGSLNEVSSALNIKPQEYLNRRIRILITAIRKSVRSLQSYRLSI